MLPCATTKVEEPLKYSRVVELSQFLKCNPGSTALTPAQSRYPVGMGAAFFLGLAFWFILAPHQHMWSLCRSVPAPAPSSTCRTALELQPRLPRIGSKSLIP